jgi:hypothetical protein
MPDKAPQKEGLQAAIDFTKYLLTLAGGAIAFVIQPASLAGGFWIKALSVAALLLLFTCVVSGLFVLAGGATNLAEGKYSLENRFVKTPGIINVVTFALGFFCLAIVILLKVLAEPESFIS